MRQSDQHVGDRLNGGYVGVDDHRQDKQADEVGHGDGALAGLEQSRRTQRNGDDPQGSRQLDGGSDLQGFRAEFGCCAHDRAGIVNGQRTPQPELILGQVQPLPDGRKDQQSHRIKDENGTQCDGELLFFSLHHRRQGRNGAAPADGRTGGNQVSGNLIDLEPFAQQNPDCQRTGDGCDGKQHAFFTRLHRAVDVHAEAQPHHRCLQEPVGCFMVQVQIWMTDELGDYQPQQQGQRGRHDRRQAEDNGPDKHQLAGSKAVVEQVLRPLFPEVQLGSGAFGGCVGSVHYVS